MFADGSYVNTETGKFWAGGTATDPSLPLK